MAPDVLCLRPEADFHRVGVVPPAELAVSYRGPSDSDVPALVGKSEALVIPAVGPVLAPDLFRNSSLKLVQVTGAGLDRVDQSALADLGIALANVPGGSNDALAEYVVSSAISLLRGFSQSGAAIRAGNYVEHRKTLLSSDPRGLGGLTVGVVGLGTIGLAVAERCHAFGARIAYYDPMPPREPDRLAALGAEALSLDALFATSDVVTLHVPLMDATRNLVAAPQLSAMKSSAVLINAARGGIVDEAALAAALENGEIAGAAVDVYSTEPPAADNPLLRVSADAAVRLILTPHIAGVSRQASQFLFSEAWQNVRRVLLDGMPPRYRVL